MSPKISIIIPVHNGEKTIQRTIDSLIAQSYKNIEIIIIDDGSTDQTNTIIEQYKNNIIIYNNENKGVSYSRNFGFKHSSGEYILFIDADDTIDEKFIENMVAKLNDTILVGAKIKKVTNTNQIINIEQKENYTRNELLKLLIQGKFEGYIWRYLFKREALFNIEFNVNLEYMEDLIFLLEYLYKNTVIENVVFTDSYYYYYENDSSVTNKANANLKNIKNIKKAMDVLLKYDNLIEEIDVTYYYYNRLAKLYESQIFRINDINEYKTIFGDDEFRNEAEKLFKNQKVDFKWKIFYNIILNTPYSIFRFYKVIRKYVKKIIRR